MGGEEQQIRCKERRIQADMPHRSRRGRGTGGFDCRPRGWAEEEKDQVQCLIGCCGANVNDTHSAGAPETLPSNSPSPSSPSTTAPFPAGSYTFTTYLDTVTTNCTTVPADWQCAPYHTYSDSPSLALAADKWIIIDSGSPSSPNLTISSSNNPFNVEFVNASLTLVDPDSSSERYMFTAHFTKVVVPSPGVYCFFNDTVVEGNLYTKRAKSGPSKISGSSTASAAQPTATQDAPSDTFEEWKYAVQTTQSIGAGSTVPECFHMNNGVRGERASNGTKPQAPEDKCSCVYQNYDL